MRIEIELRYSILDKELLTPFINSLTFLQTKQIVDIYLDTAEENLRQEGIFIRLRNNKTIDIKFNRACLEDKTLALQAYCEEYSFDLLTMHDTLHKFSALNHELGLKSSNPFTLDNYKLVNDLINHRVVDKIRSSYKTNDFIVVIDDVKPLEHSLKLN